MISSDSPITREQDDRLGRTPFAKSLAKAVLEFRGDDSFVIGIHGKWGTGKSSVLNLFAQELNQASTQGTATVDVLRFNPWNFSDQNQLVLQFLRQFTAHLRSLDKKNTGKMKTLLENLAGYSEALSPPIEAIPYGGKLFSMGLKIATKALGHGRDADSLFQTVSNQLKELKRKTVVIIDDIDRLTAAEIRQIFQLVKLSARFPYVVYVLAFDRDAVAQALTELGVSSGEKYLEKIVQVSFDLPPISEQAMSSMISTAIEEIVNKYPSAHFDNQRYGNLFHSGFRRSFESLRDVRRFINGLEFGFGMIAKEVNGVDFIGIEALRVFYPKVFDAIRQNKEIFSGYIDDFTREEGSDAFKTKVDQIFKAAGADLEQCRELVIELFPKLQYAYSRTLYGHNSEAQWEKSFRVCSRRYFDFYFQLVVPEGEVSSAEIETTVECTCDQNQLIKNLVQYIDSDRIRPALESFRARLKSVPPDRLANVFGALIDIGDRVKHSGSMIAGRVPEFLYVSWAIFDVLNLMSAQQRVTILDDRFRSTDGIGTAVDVLDTIKAINKEQDNKYSEFDEAALANLRKVVVGRIKQLASTRSLLDKEFLPKILYFWKTWGDATEVSKYVTGVLSGPDGDFLRFLDKFIYQSTSVAMGERVARIKNKVAIRGLAAVIDIKDVTKRVSLIKEKELPSAHEKEILEIVKNSLDMFQKSGLAPEQFDQAPEFDD